MTQRTADESKYEESIYNIRSMWQDSFYGDKPVTIRSWDDMTSEFSTYAGGIICGNYSFSEHMKHCCKNTYHSSGINYDNGGITLAEFTIPELRYHWSLAMTDKWKEYLVFKYFEGFVPPTFVDEQMQVTLKKYGIKCAVGQKTSRVLNKFFISCGIDTDEDYSKQYGNLSDAINPVNIRRHTLLSVHPCDFLHMSYGVIRIILTFSVDPI